MKYKHTTAEEIDAIVARFAVLEHVGSVAQELGLDVQRIRGALKRRGVVLSKNSHRLNSCLKNKALVLQMAADGKSLSEIGRRVGTNGCHVKNFVLKHMPDWKLNTDTSGSRNNRWKGGRRIDKDGYVLIHVPDHPNCDSHGLMREHRLVMEKMIGRYLLPEEVVHHRSKNKADNSPENLQLFSENSEHLRHELTGHVPNWTESGKQRIAEGVGRAVIANIKRIQLALKPNASESP